MKVKRIKKFEKMVLEVNLLSEKKVFFAICKEVGNCFASLSFNEEQWEEIRKFVLGNKKQFSSIHQILKDKHSASLSVFNVEIEVRRITSIYFHRIFKNQEFIIYPDLDKQRMLRINTTMVFDGGKVIPEAIVIVDYFKNPSLEHWEGYLNLWNKLENTKGFRGLKRLAYQEEDVFEKN